uniref:Uncharacterized protein n=1 Tax=Solanum lycopersicum TaxID=4081 RepID=A0A3Q7F5F7_SOLLC
MKERMQKMEKQMEEQKKIVRQEVIADVIAQLKHEGLIDPNILTALSTPSPRESTSVQGAKQVWTLDSAAGLLFLLLVMKSKKGMKAVVKT